MVILFVLLLLLGLAPLCALILKKAGYLAVCAGGLLLAYLGIQDHSVNPLYLLYVSAGIVWVLSSVYSMSYDKHERWLAPLFGLSVFGMALAFTANNTLVFLAGYEIMTIPAYASVGVYKHTDYPAFVYMSFGELSTLLVLAGFLYSYTLTGSFGFSALNTPVPFVLSSMGFIVKMGMLPFMVTEWLPLAHGNTPSNMSAILSASMTLVAFYGLLKMALLSPSMENFGLLLTGIGGFSVFFGSLYSYVSEQPKSLLGFSTIESNGAMLTCAGIFTSAPTHLLAVFALITASVYALAHSIAKTGLFLMTGSMDPESFSHPDTGKDRLGKIGGIMLTSSMSGLLPTVGGVAVWSLLEAIFMEAFTLHTALAAVPIVVGSVIALGEGFATASMLKFVLFTEVFSTHTSKGRSGGGVILFAGLGALLSGWLTYFVYTPFTGASPLGVPFGLIISESSSAPFGGITPLYVLGLPLLFALVLLLAFGKPKTRRSEVWNTGLPRTHTYTSPMYSNNIRLMLAKILLTRVSSEGAKTTDFLWSWICATGRGFLRFSKSFSRTYMNSNLSWYVLYMIIAFVVLIMVIVR
jgi:hydrogenase-4 component B